MSRKLTILALFMHIHVFSQNRMSSVTYVLKSHSVELTKMMICLLYTSDAADDMQCVDLGGRRIIKKF